MYFKSVELDEGAVILVREFTVHDAISFTAARIEDIHTLRHLINGVIVTQGIDVINLTEPQIDTLMEVVTDLHPALFSDKSTQHQTDDASKASARKKATTLRLMRHVLTFTENGHPNILTYPFSYYTELCNLHAGQQT